MNKNALMNLRTQLKPRFIEFLTTTGKPYFEPALTVCPLCGDHAAILFETMWSCQKCGKHGDIVDYVLADGLHRTENDAVKYLCRLFKIKVGELDVIRADELMDKSFGISEPLIDRLLGRGMYVLAGPSKIGKSWMVLHMATAVSKGAPLWEFRTHQADVLYISLEDPERRLQRRLAELMNGEDLSHIWFATEAEFVGEGFEEQLTNFLKHHRETKFVIIDTLQRIRQAEIRNYSYGMDYANMAALKDIADRFEITLLLVHHTRKQGSNDPFDLISGTTGIMGCADGALVLQKHTRQEKRGILSVVGRDIPDIQLDLEFDTDALCWKFLGFRNPEAPTKENLLLKAISEFMTGRDKWRGTATELLNELKGNTDMTPNVLSRKLNALSSELFNDYGILYRAGKSNDQRYLILENKGEPKEAGTSQDTKDDEEVA